ncbi:MAG: hypothetical protein ABH834_00875 [Candidatus Altiarchaeota archaeon]
MTSSNWKGIPSKESLHFPEKGGRKFGQKIWDSSFRWQVEDLMEFLFPSERMPKHNEVAVEYVKFLLRNGDNTEDGKKEFCQKTGYSFNTVRKHIIPKLYRFGLIHRTRELPKHTAWNIKSKRKSHEKESLSFSTMLRKIADEWESMVTTARMRRQVEERKDKDEMREIKRQEKLDWERWEKEREY